MERKSLSKKMRFEIYKRDNFTCQYCGNSAPSVILEIDHIHPYSEGGGCDMMNLVTSCESCNRGKGNRLLSDNTAVERQITQLKRINEKREQLELLLEWRQELEAFSQKSFEVLVNFWERSTHSSLDERGKIQFKKLLSRHGVEKLLDAIQESCTAYLVPNKKGIYTKKSVDIAFDKITLFLKLQNMPAETRELLYVRGILNNRFSFIDWSLSFELMQEAHSLGISVGEIKRLAITTKCWSEFSETLQDWIEDHLEYKTDPRQEVNAEDK
jgi:hypothetical protein